MSGGGPVVVIVDDHRVLSDAVARSLRGFGCDVTVATSFGQQDLEREVRRRAPVVVLLDMHLGDTLSLPLIRPLIAAGATVIVLTADGDPRLLGHALLEGAAAALPKELPFDDIVLAIHQTWSGAPGMSRSKRDSLMALARERDEEERRRLAPFEALTAREQVVLRHLLNGRSPKEIAREEYVKLPTVRSQLRTLYAKLGVSSQREAIAAAQKVNWS